MTEALHVKTLTSLKLGNSCLMCVLFVAFEYV